MPKDSSLNKPLLTSAQLAAALGCSVRTIMRLVKNKTITSYRFSPPRGGPSRHRFDLDEVKKQLNPDPREKGLNGSRKRR